MVSALVLAGCGRAPSDLSGDPLHDRAAMPAWVEWPAEVRSHQPIVIRAVMSPRCLDGGLVLSRTLQDTILMLQGEWVALRSLLEVCDSTESTQAFSTFEAAIVSGPPRTVYLHVPDPDKPGYRLGSFAVVDRIPDDTVRAAGSAILSQDASGCARITAGAVWENHTTYQFEGISASKGNPFFAEGYLTHASTACQLGPADTMVFHLTAERLQPPGPPD